MELCFSYNEKTPRIRSFAFLIKGGLPEYGAKVWLCRKEKILKCNGRFIVDSKSEAMNAKISN